MPQNRRSVHRKKYLGYLLEHIMRHDLVTKTQNISDQVQDKMDLMDEIRKALDNIDTLQIQGMLAAEQQCRKLHTRPYGWTPLVTILIQEIKYWRYAMKRAKGQSYHARILFRIRKALPQLGDASTLLTEVLKNNLLKRKAELRKQLGDPNWQQTWLEELAEAQAQAQKTTAKK